MSENASLARTGSGLGAVVIGGTVITGWWIAGIALGVVIVGAVLVRWSFRSGRTAGER